MGLADSVRCNDLKDQCVCGYQRVRQLGAVVFQVHPKYSIPSPRIQQGTEATQFLINAPSRRRTYHLALFS
jgi:hypothetical protein